MYDEAFQQNVTDDTYVLLKKAKQGDKAALEEIVRRNTPLVHSVVRHFLDRGCEYDDLFQLGSIGLVKAARNYDPSFETKFSTYAVPMIMGEIKRFLRDDGMIRISRNIKENARRVADARERLLAANSGEPTVSELAEETSLSREEVVEALDSSRQIASIYEVVAEGDNSQMLLADKIPDEENTENALGTKILMDEILRSLDGESKEIIIMRYFRCMTQCDVAKKLGISQVQVSRKEKKILLELRKRCS